MSSATGARGRSARRARLATIDEEVTTGLSKKQEGHAFYSHSAVCAEAKVDEELGTARVARVVSAVAGGRILNPTTARSQVLGGIVWGSSGRSKRRA